MDEIKRFLKEEEKQTSLMLRVVSGMKVLRCRKGGAAIEFGIVLPLLVVLVFGIIEFGILMYNKAVITNASREGARAGIVSTPRLPLTGTTSITSVVNNYCQNHLITFGIAANPNTALGGSGNPCANFGEELDVNVTYVYKFLVFSRLVPGFGSTITLGAETKMLCM